MTFPYELACHREDQDVIRKECLSAWYHLTIPTMWQPPADLIDGSVPN